MADKGSKSRGVLLALAAGAIVAAGVAGCAPSSSSDQAPPPTASLRITPGSSVPSVVLTQLGAQRIGVRTTPVQAGAGGMAVFPYSALLYEPDGKTVVYVPTGTLTYLRHFVTVAAIDGNVVVVKSGVAPGQDVVVTGAEELLGVQNGVGEET
jgi:multidrug efflux pump subunit AcrA (membrane-fusion protein)